MSGKGKVSIAEATLKVAFAFLAGLSPPMLFVDLILQSQYRYGRLSAVENGFMCGVMLSHVVLVFWLVGNCDGFCRTLASLFRRSSQGVSVVSRILMAVLMAIYVFGLALLTPRFFLTSCGVFIAKKLFANCLFAFGRI